MAAVFLASWCPFCTQFQPAFEAAARVNGIIWGSVDLSDDENTLWDVFNIEVVPSIIAFKDGKPVWRKDGVRGRGLSEEAIAETMSQMKFLSAES